MGLSATNRAGNSFQTSCTPEHNLTNRTLDNIWLLLPHKPSPPSASPPSPPRLHPSPSSLSLSVFLDIHVDSRFAAGVCERRQRRVSADSKLWCTKQTSWPPVVACSTLSCSLCDKRKLFRVRKAYLMVSAVQHCVWKLWGNQIVTPQLGMFCVLPGGLLNVEVSRSAFGYG